MKAVWILGLAVCLMGGNAFATPVVACSSLTTFQDFLDNQDPEGCISEDKIYSDWSGTIPGSTSIDISEVTGVIDYHVVDIGLIPVGAWTLAYSIAIDPAEPDYALRNITNVSMDVTVPNAGPFVSKGIYASMGGTLLDTLVSAGAPDSSIPLLVKSLYIQDSITVPTNTVLLGIGQTFVQEVGEEPPGGEVPEPSTYLLMGAGLLALGFARWRQNPKRR